YPKFFVPNLVLVLEQRSRWRTRSPRTVFVIHAAMAGTHEEPRLSKPSDRAAEMGAVDRKDLELRALESPNPAGDVRCGPVPGHPERVRVRGEPRLALGEALQRTQTDPRLHGSLANGTEDVTDHGNTYQGRGHHIEAQPELEQKAAARARR